MLAADPIATAKVVVQVDNILAHAFCFLKVGRVLLAVNLGLSMADVQWLFGHSDTTLRLWLSRAGAPAEKVHTLSFRNLQIGHLQFDELYTTLRDKTHDLWVWVAFDPQSKLIPALQLGPRTQDLAHVLVHAVKLTLAPGCVPACTSDGLKLYYYALTAHFGQWLTDPVTGKPKWHAQRPWNCPMAKSPKPIAAVSSPKSNAECNSVNSRICRSPSNR